MGQLTRYALSLRPSDVNHPVPLTLEERHIICCVTYLVPGTMNKIAIIKRITIFFDFYATKNLPVHYHKEGIKPTRFSHFFSLLSCYFIYFVYLCRQIEIDCL